MPPTDRTHEDEALRLLHDARHLTGSPANTASLLAAQVHATLHLADLLARSLSTPPLVFLTSSSSPTSGVDVLHSLADRIREHYAQRTAETGGVR